MSRLDITQGSPVHKRLCTNKTHNIVKKKSDKEQITCDMWHANGFYVIGFTFELNTYNIKYLYGLLDYLHIIRLILSLLWRRDTFFQSHWESNTIIIIYNIKLFMDVNSLNDPIWVNWDLSMIVVD